MDFVLGVSEAHTITGAVEYRIPLVAVADTQLDVAVGCSLVGVVAQFHSVGMSSSGFAEVFQTPPGIGITRIWVFWEVGSIVALGLESFCSSCSSHCNPLWQIYKSQRSPD